MGTLFDAPQAENAVRVIDNFIILLSDMGIRHGAGLDAGGTAIAPHRILPEHEHRPAVKPRGDQPDRTDTAPQTSADHERGEKKYKCCPGEHGKHTRYGIGEITPGGHAQSEQRAQYPSWTYLAVRKKQVAAHVFKIPVSADP